METLTAWKAVLLGAIQGATEFLPISSSGHLVILQQWLGLTQNGDGLLAFDVALHLGTLGAVVWILRRDIFRMNFRLALLLVLGTIPAGICGVAFKDFFTLLFADALPTAFFLIVTGLILWTTRWTRASEARRTETSIDRVGKKEAWWIGVAQAVAILPGVSRSGSTIAAGLWMKLTPDAAVRFSFLLAIPAILGAAIFEAKALTSLPSDTWVLVLLGIATSFVVGYAAIRWMLRLVAGRKLHLFAWYCWGVGIFAIAKELFF